MNQTWLGNPALNPAQYPGTDRGKGWQEADYTEELEIGYRWYDAQAERASAATGLTQNSASHPSSGVAVTETAAKPLFPFGCVVCPPSPPPPQHN